MRALMPGSYDPCTRGHLAMIERAAHAFSGVTVAVCIHPDKRGTFAFSERVEFLRLATAHLANVEVIFSDGYVADLAAAGGYSCILKGVRNETDRRYEEEMAEYNLTRGGVPTVLWDADGGMEEYSSTAVRDALSRGEAIDALVPPAALAAIVSSYEKKHRPPCGGGSAVL